MRGGKRSTKIGPPRGKQGSTIPFLGDEKEWSDSREKQIQFSVKRGGKNQDFHNQEKKEERSSSPSKILKEPFWGGGGDIFRTTLDSDKGNESQIGKKG